MHGSMSKFGMFISYFYSLRFCYSKGVVRHNLILKNHGINTKDTKLGGELMDGLNEIIDANFYNGRNANHLRWMTCM
jgi:hypothetical protein